MSVEVMELFNIFSKTYTKEDAQVIVKDIETLISDHKRELATKEDVKESELKLTKEIEIIRGEIKETELKLTREIELTRGEIRETELKLTREIELTRRETESVRLEVEKAKSSLVRWFAGLLIAYTGVIVTILTLWK